MMRSGGAEGYLKGKLTGPLEEGPKGSALLALPTKMKQAGGGKAASSGWNTLKEALRRCSALAAKAEVSYASISRHFLLESNTEREIPPPTPHRNQQI